MNINIRQCSVHSLPIKKGNQSMELQKSMSMPETQAVVGHGEADYRVQRKLNWKRCVLLCEIFLKKIQNKEFISIVYNLSFHPSLMTFHSYNDLKLKQ